MQFTLNYRKVSITWLNVVRTFYFQERFDGQGVWNLNWYLLTAGNYKSACEQLQNSGHLQNKPVNGTMLISVSYNSNCANNNW